MILNRGTLIAGRYEILEQIGQGGMSYVYRALDKKLERDVTVKVLREEYNTDANFLARFDTEAKAVASLNHANIVDVYDVGNEGDIKYIVMEYVAGKTLKELITERAPFTNDTMLGVAEQITLALMHAHENGIIHKDIKPQNILVMPNGDVKVADFGIADHKNNARVTEEGSTMGSVHYISPEGACNDPVDVRSDLYSLGITMYEMMTGELPFDSEDPDEIPAMHMGAPFPNMARKNAEILPTVREIILKLTQKLPHRRYQSANGLYNDIKHAAMEATKYNQFQASDRGHTGAIHTATASTGGQSARRPAPRTKSPAAAKKDRLLMAGGIGAAVVVLGLLGFGLVWLIGLFGNDEPEGYVNIPGVIGHDASRIISELEALGLRLDIQEDYHPTIPEGQIFDSNVRSPGLWDVSEVIELMVSLGPSDRANFSVPNIEGMSIESASEMFENLPVSLYIADSAFSQNIPQGYIIMQDPPAGTLVVEGSTISIIESRGPQTQMVAVPNLFGLSQANAQSQILLNNLVFGEITAEESDTHPRGAIIRQSPAAGAQVPPGTAVDFVVSDGVLDDEDPPPTGDATTPAVTTPVTTEPGDDENGYEEQTTVATTPSETTPAPAQTTQVLTLNPVLSEGNSYELRLERREGGQTSNAGAMTATSAQMPWHLTVSGAVGSTAEFVLFINGVESGSQMVTFSD